jgi:DNA-binding MarR family transcriptional regulator
MSIESDIKQDKPFRSEKEKVLVNLIFTHNQVVEKYYRALKIHDISLQQYNVLRILNGQNGSPVNIQTISERMLDRMSNASRLVDKLFAKKLVQRKINTLNKRNVDVSITSKGKAFLEKMNEIMDDVPLANSFNSEDFSKFNQFLDNLRS